MWTSKDIVQAVTISLLCSFALAFPAQNSGILHCVMISYSYCYSNFNIKIIANKFFKSIFCVRKIQ